MAEAGPVLAAKVQPGSTDPVSRADPVHQADRGLTKACSKWVRWAREELNLRPPPCQLQRAATDPYVGWLEIGKDQWKAAGKRSCQCPPLRRSTTILQRSSWSLRQSVAARLLPLRAKPDPRYHNLIRSL